MPYNVVVAQHKTCGRCGQKVYKGKWARHERDCVSVSVRFGGVGPLADLWRDDGNLRVSDLVRLLPGVSRYVMKSMLAAGGIAPADIDEREGQETVARRPRCARCRILLDARGVRPGTTDPTLCWWCDESAPPAPRPADGLPVVLVAAERPSARRHGHAAEYPHR